MNIGQIKHPYIKIQPTPVLKQYIKNIEYSQDLPPVIANFILKNKINPPPPPPVSSTKRKSLITTGDAHFIRTLKLEKYKKQKTQKPGCKEKIDADESEQLLSLFELDWLFDYIQNQNKITNKKVYLHELLNGAQIIYPKNDQIPRSEELERRCNELKARQQALEYNKMTKNVDASRRQLPEDTIGYQLRQMNRHLIAIFQFIMSVLAGFAFGFLGVELIVGNLDFGFRLLLGIICSLVIALAELYFLAKKLNEDLQYETEVRKNK